VDEQITPRHLRRPSALYRSSRGLAVAAALVAVLAIAGCVAAYLRGQRHHPSGPAGAAGTSARSTSAGAPLQDPVPQPTQAAGAAVPVRISVPRLGITSSLQHLHLQKDGELQPPSTWQQAGWYSDGIRPGDVGPAVIAGHVDSVNGPAVFFRLKEARTGDVIRVTQVSGRTFTFVVTEVRSYPKSHFPSTAVYGPTALPELRLVTCTGEFDYVHRNYLDNLVVFAVLRPAGS
jgi:Sortase domain